MTVNNGNRGARTFLLLVLALDLANTLQKYIENFPFIEHKLSAALVMLLHIAPLVALTMLDRIIQKIRGRAALARIRAGLAAYVAVEVALPFLHLPDEIELPGFAGILFYSRGWVDSLERTVSDFQPVFFADTAIFALHWFSCWLLLEEISGLINPPADPGGKISASFKIAVAGLFSLALHVALNAAIVRMLEDNNGTGEHALGIMFVALLLLAAKLAAAIPTAVLSLVGIVCACSVKNKLRRRNEAALNMNAAILTACGIIALFVW